MLNNNCYPQNIPPLSAYYNDVQITERVIGMAKSPTTIRLDDDLKEISKILRINGIEHQ